MTKIDPHAQFAKGFSAWPEKPFVSSRLPQHPPQTFDRALRSFEVDDPAIQLRTVLGSRHWKSLESQLLRACHEGYSVAKNLTQRPLSPAEQNYYCSLLQKLRSEVGGLFWEQESGVDQAQLNISFKQDEQPISLQLAAASRGKPLAATKGIFMIPGFGPDNRTFQTVLANYAPESSEAVVSASLLGVGARVPSEIKDLAPETLIDIYTEAVQTAFPNATEITLVGNSMGTMIALGVAARLQTEGIQINLVLDNTMGPKPLDDLKPLLLKMAKLVRPWELSTKLALGVVTEIPWTRESLVDTWYGNSHVEPHADDFYYYENHFDFPAPDGALSTVATLARMATQLHRWNGNPTVAKFDPSQSQIVFIDSLDNHFFPPQTTDRLYKTMEAKFPEGVHLIRKPGAHVPPLGDRRILEALEIIKNDGRE